MLDTDLLVSKGEYYEFVRDTIFSSPTAAANIILGRHTPGPITWVNGENKTLKDVLQNISFL